MPSNHKQGGKAWKGCITEVLTKAEDEREASCIFVVLIFCVGWTPYISRVLSGRLTNSHFLSTYKKPRRTIVSRKVELELRLVWVIYGAELFENPDRTTLDPSFKWFRHWEGPFPLETARYIFPTEYKQAAEE
ncbi:uncharacterized protein CLUP02_09872 [Colletotrichum lupini]|uniref:Uncharacterized protein n=1 Tax=Colletotrichum lupini TaxID=145971 RepID=A0A9Q8SVM5_9PEZI|nr:uncharacterized protein CLUP02_09872 [Colletotrichum lupini]UQC84376.1 hypothetical protein CLUP02_09872 [Colletotrichum lupini]